MTERRITDRPLLADDVIFWLEKAGTTLQCLPDTGPRLDVRLMSIELRMAAQLEAREQLSLRPSVGAGDIEAMDIAFGWLALIDNRTERRIVCARLLVDPRTGRHRHAWRAIGRLLGADYHAVQRWWESGIDKIVSRIAEREAMRPAA